MKKPLKLELIRRDGGTQARAELDAFVVDDYAAAYLAKVDMPAPLVFFDGEAHWLADGFHRVEGAEKAGRRLLECEVKRGGLRDAILFAAGANAQHGLRRTNADKRGAVLLLLRDKEFGLWSDRKIGQACAVDHKTVARIRREQSGEIPTGGELEGEPADLQRRSRVVQPPRPAESVKLLPEARQVLRDTGLADDLSQVRELARLQPEHQERVAIRLTLGARTVKEARDQEKRAELHQQAAALAAAPPPLPDGPFDVIAADPPWSFDSRSEDPSHRGRTDYAVMSLEKIEALPVERLAKPDALLFLWVPNALLSQGLQVVSAWGFEQRTVLTWDKEMLGVGNWLRNSTEQCLVAVKGSAAGHAHQSADADPGAPARPQPEAGDVLRAGGEPLPRRQGGALCSNSEGWMGGLGGREGEVRVRPQSRMFRAGLLERVSFVGQLRGLKACSGPTKQLIPVQCLSAESAD